MTFRLPLILFLLLAGIYSSLEAQNFRVQLLALADSMPPAYFKARGIDRVIVTRDDFGVYHYFTGSYPTREAAEPVVKDARIRGFTHATIIDLEELRVLAWKDCSYFQYGQLFVQDTAAGTVRSALFFEFGSENLDATAKAELDRVGQKMKENPQYQLQIRGYTDGVGSAQSNIQLATNRARAARNYLIDRCGIRPDRMFLHVYGEANPLAPNKTEEGADLPSERKWNRRVELELTL